MRINKINPATVAMATSIFMLLSDSAVFAQSAPSAPSGNATSSVFCALLNYLFPVATRAAIAIVAGMAALFSMWQEQSNIFTWIKKHNVMFIFCIVFIAGPTILVSVLGASGSGCTFA